MGADPSLVPEGVGVDVGDLKGLTVALDTRARAPSGGGGVAAYRGALGEALTLAGARVNAVTDGSAAPDSGRLHRLARALDRRPRRLVAAQSACGVEGWIAADLFRSAQVHFDLFGSLLEVRCASPPEVMHWTYPLPMRMAGTLNVYTIHDLIPLERPDLSPVRPRRMARLLDRVVEAADLIVTVSDASRGAILQRFQLAPERVVNTYQATSRAWTAPAVLPPPPFGLQPGGYFIYCGAVERRKNVGRLIAAHAASGVATPLLMVGPDGFGAAGELEAFDAASGRVVRAPWLERSELLALIVQARALAFPSLAEGFGLPVLEAMTLGVPVVTSRDGALGEIAGQAALLVDPLDVSALAQALTALAQDDDLHRALALAGRSRAQAFSMTRYAARLSAAYRALDRR